MPNNIGQQDTAHNDRSQTHQQTCNITFYRKHAEALQPAPQRDEAGDGTVEEICCSSQIAVSTCFPVHKIRACKHKKEGINTIAKAFLQFYMGGAYGIQQDLQQLADHNCQAPCGNHCQRHPNAQAKIQHQIWQLE